MELLAEELDGFVVILDNKGNMDDRLVHFYTHLLSPLGDLFSGDR
jgi:hypothetical protein